MSWLNQVSSRWRAKKTQQHETKNSKANGLISLHSTGRPVWSPNNYSTYAKEGFAENAVGFRCVKMIAEAAASIPWQLHVAGQTVDEHPVLSLLNHPNTAESGRSLMEGFYANLQISGNAYLEAGCIGQTVRELHLLRPDRMKVIPGQSGWPDGFEYSVNGKSVRFDQTGDGIAPIFHMKMYNPTDDYYGMSPFQAAGKAIDIHNAAGAWNKALLDNAARPSGALVYGGGEGDENLTNEQFERLKSELENTFQGAANAGRPMVLEGGLDWKPLSLSPKDMEHIEAKHVAAREIALAFGVPPMLLGIPGDNTFANYAEANRTFWRQTVLPLAQRTSQSLSNWLCVRYKDGPHLDINTDQISALTIEKEALRKRIASADFLSQDEKRQLVGLPPLTNK